MSYNYNIKDWYSMSDSSIIKELGIYVRELRLKKNYTQSNLALKAGVHRVTLSEFENGMRGSLNTFIQLLRALDELEVLNVFKIDNTISPLQMAKLEAKKRKRASTALNKNSVIDRKARPVKKSKNKK